MNRRHIAVAAAGSTFFTAVYEAGVYAVPGTMPLLPTLAGLVCPPLVAVLWLGIMTTHPGDDAVIAPYVPPAQRKALPAAQRRALLDRAGSTQTVGARHG